MARRKRPTEDERIVFGKLCGCGKCAFCMAWEHEQILQRMDDEVRRGVEIATTAREELVRKWKEKRDE